MKDSTDPAGNARAAKLAAPRRIGMDMTAPWSVYVDGRVVKERSSSEHAADRRYRRLVALNRRVRLIPAAA